MINLRLGKLIAQHIENKGITHGRLADKLGWARSTVTSKLNGDREITVQQANDMAEAVDMELGQLLLEASGYQVITKDKERKLLNLMSELSEEDQEMLLTFAKRLGQ